MKETLVKIESLIAIGRITKPQGLAGEVRISPLTDFPERFKSLESLYLTRRNLVSSRKIEAVRYANKNIIIKFDGIDSRTEAESLVGWTLNVEDHQAVELPEDTFFIHDVIGATVYSDDEEKIGIVGDVYQLPANDLLVVKNDDKGKEYLIPVVDEFLKEIDLEEKKIIVHVMDGLLD